MSIAHRHFWTTTRDQARASAVGSLMFVAGVVSGVVLLVLVGWWSVFLLVAYVLWCANHYAADAARAAGAGQGEP